MTTECPDHGNEGIKIIPAGYSKKKQKSYEAFSVCGVKDCSFTGPAPDEKETQNTSPLYAPPSSVSPSSKPTPSTPVDEEDDIPMKRKDWDIKDFVVGLGVFSSAARKEGMPPSEAFKTMSIWEWMDLAYGDMPGYEAWKAKAKKRIK